MTTRTNAVDRGMPGRAVTNPVRRDDHDGDGNGGRKRSGRSTSRLGRRGSAAAAAGDAAPRPMSRP
jgi:hypothetical protein